jgi:hypothetical protein
MRVPAYYAGTLTLSQFVMSTARHIPRLRLPKGAPFLEAIRSLCARAALRTVPEAAGTVRGPATTAARSGPGRFFCGQMGAGYA